MAQISGEIDVSNAVDIREQLLATVTPVPEGIHLLVIDLTGLRFVDSAGIARLFEVSAGLLRAGVRVIVVVPPDGIVRRTLELTRFDRNIPLVASLDEATNGSGPARRTWD